MNTTPSAKSTSKKSGSDLSFAFDVGHSSIGWAVLQNSGDKAQPNILGCGTVIFPADDCLASQRRGFRRQRRHIRSTRQRIARMKTLLAHLGVLGRDQLDAPGCAWPWKLAARVLRGGDLLTWPELWDVLRWYAHNRGYDGNRRWSSGADDPETLKEDSEKEQNAISLMQKHSLSTMAETFCRELGVEPAGKKRSSTVRFKGLNAAFPRRVVEEEVRRVLRAHFGELEKIDVDLERALIGRDGNDKLAWQAIACPDLKLPKRYQGGLLFGQLVPRFDNRIISRCQITGAKVPTRHCPEFLNFRWAMLLANIKVARPGETELMPLTSEERKEIDAAMREAGAMTESEMKKLVRKVTRAVRDKLDQMFMEEVNAKEALVLDPVKKLTRSDKLKTLWPLLPEKIQRRASNVWRRGKAITLLGLRERLESSGESTAQFDAEIERLFDAASMKKRRKDKTLTREEFLAEPLRPDDSSLSGRAAYARPILRQAFAEVMAGKHPKEEGGCLFRAEEIRDAQLQRKIDNQTNNHLIRHRLLILQRLLRDAIVEFADGDKSHIGRVIIEVNRDLREMSGKTNKEIAQDLGLRLANFKSVVKKLEADESFMRELRRRGLHRIPPGLIRKARIAEDLGWKCPYTSQSYEPTDLLTRRVDKDHIVPRSDRMSDALDSLVITFSAVNKWKSKRTALKFIEDEQGKPVPDLPNLSVLSVSRYKEFVDALDSRRGHDDDQRRKRRRKELLLLREYEEKEFTPGDLTQTSQLVRLGALAIRKEFLNEKKQPVVIPLPGSVTGTLRKGWNKNLLGCLSTACPQVLDNDGEVKTKTDIRDITHLHHALDAIVLGLADYYIPNNGRIWELIVKRRLDDTEKLELRALGIFDFSPEGFGLKALPAKIDAQVRQRLAEKRVVQHIPARMDGLPVDQNMWRLKGWTPNGRAILEKHSRDATGARKKDNPKPGADNKERLIGWDPKDGEGKLKKLKAVLITNENYGLALDPELRVISFHKVWEALQHIREANDGKRPRILRNGNLITVSDGDAFDTWRVFSIKNTTGMGIVLDLGRPDEIRASWINVRVRSLLKKGMAVAKTSLVGQATCPSTSSA